MTSNNAKTMLLFFLKRNTLEKNSNLRVHLVHINRHVLSHAADEKFQPDHIFKLADCSKELFKCPHSFLLGLHQSAQHWYKNVLYLPTIFKQT